jgi:hypothetical protein
MPMNETTRGSSPQQTPPSPTGSAALLPSRVSTRWKESDRHKVAEMLLHTYPQLSIDQLLDAVRECEHGSAPLAGWEELATCTQKHLEKRRGTATRRREAQRSIRV